MIFLLKIMSTEEENDLTNLYLTERSAADYPVKKMLCMDRLKRRATLDLIRRKLQTIRTEQSFKNQVKGSNLEIYTNNAKSCRYWEQRLHAKKFIRELVS